MILGKLCLEDNWDVADTNDMTTADLGDRKAVSKFNQAWEEWLA